MNQINDEKKQNEISINVLNIGYFYHYRKIKHNFVKNQMEDVERQYPSLNQNQKDGIETMLKIELIVNAIQYCEDLAQIFIALLKKREKYLRILCSVHETGCGSVSEFYEKIGNQDFNYFYLLLCLNKFDLSEKDELACIDRIHILRNDLNFISIFFKKFFNLYTSYKHGLLMYPGKLRETGENVVVELGLQETSNILFVDRIPFNIEAVILILHSIFLTIIEAQIINNILTKEEQKMTNFEKNVSVLASNEGDSFKIDLASYRIHIAKEIIPLYISPITRPNKK